MRLSFAGLLAAALLSGIAAAQAGPELVSNGGFEQTSFAGSHEFGSSSGAGGDAVTGWKTSGYNWLFAPGQADTVGGGGQYGTLKLWGPGDGSDNGLTSSPAGGNYIAADGAYEVGAISQTIMGLTRGATYAVSFYYAGAQQYGFTGTNTEQWDVSLGSQKQATPVLDNTSKGFTG